MNFALFVSYDLGVVFAEHKKASSLEELEKDCKCFDSNWIRWYINDEKNETVKICAIYQNLLTDMEKRKKENGVCLFATDDAKAKELLTLHGVTVLSTDEMISKLSGAVGKLH